MATLCELLVVITACIIVLAEVFDKVDTHKSVVKNFLGIGKEEEV